ncbi:hypothetical protein GUJ93_ZPchr0007g5040 [Zizania palustris]|uniref:Uncharacterized protein n=1 Tax=Zizania palustris TaxID=103762 RepID=A0A8J5R683_ZIZPA|nr:hypothetical protein GUJ93_ZPchr2171g28985 [Zizania palustris]KAG8080256.1 hypothetical protein GUJ93_ZPchr0007g5040 [Zizania palustris]
MGDDVRLDGDRTGARLGVGEVIGGDKPCNSVNSMGRVQKRRRTGGGGEIPVGPCGAPAYGGVSEDGRRRAGVYGVRE